MTFDNRKNGLTNFFSLVMILGKDGFVGWEFFLFILHFAKGDIVHYHVNIYDYHYSQPSIKKKHINSIFLPKTNSELKIYVQLKNFEMLEKLEWNVIIRHIITWNFHQKIYLYVKIVGFKPKKFWVLNVSTKLSSFFSPSPWFKLGDCKCDALHKINMVYGGL